MPEEREKGRLQWKEEKGERERRSSTHTAPAISLTGNGSNQSL